MPPKDSRLKYCPFTVQEKRDDEGRQYQTVCSEEHCRFWFAINPIAHEGKCAIVKFLETWGGFAAFLQGELGEIFRLGMKFKWYKPTKQEVEDYKRSKKQD